MPENNEFSPLTFVPVWLDSPPFYVQKNLIYAQYKISRTPHARQRTQAPTQPRHQIQPAQRGKRLPCARHRREKRRGQESPARRPLRPRQGRQVRRAHPPHRQPEKIPARGGVELISGEI